MAANVLLTGNGLSVTLVSAMDTDRFCPSCFCKFPASERVCPVDGTTLVSLVDSDLTGQVLDKRYHVVERIGSGGMGVVYKADQKLIGRKLALKVLRRDIVASEVSVKRFLTEARATASLRSPRTITFHDFGVTDDGLLYYTMELLEGRPLSKIIKEDGPFDFRRAAILVGQVCESLEEAHAKGILHRDLKPDNLFVVREGGVEAIKVMDFGIAKVLNDPQSQSITQTGSLCGTPQYVSPEQATGRPASSASDMYSLGVVFFEMLAGRPPFRGPGITAVLLEHVQKAPPSVSEVNPSVSIPESLERFLERALSKEPSTRYRSASEFKRCLKTALQGSARLDGTASAISVPEDQSGEVAPANTQPFEQQKSVHTASRFPMLEESQANSSVPSLAVGSDEVDRSNRWHRKALTPHSRQLAMATTGQSLSDIFVKAGNRYLKWVLGLAVGLIVVGLGGYGFYRLITDPPEESRVMDTPGRLAKSPSEESPLGHEAHPGSNDSESVPNETARPWSYPDISEVDHGVTKRSAEERCFSPGDIRLQEPETAVSMPSGSAKQEDGEPAPDGSESPVAVDEVPAYLSHTATLDVQVEVEKVADGTVPKSIEIASIPKEFEVVVAGKTRGMTPMVLEVSSDGPLPEIVLRRSGFSELVHQLTLEDGDRVELRPRKLPGRSSGRHHGKSGKSRKTGASDSGESKQEKKGEEKGYFRL
jgi:serine/threonine protein kinase